MTFVFVDQNLYGGVKSHSPVFTLRNTKEDPFSLKYALFLKLSRAFAFHLSSAMDQDHFFKLIEEPRGAPLPSKSARWQHLTLKGTLATATDTYRKIRRQTECGENCAAIRAE